MALNTQLDATPQEHLYLPYDTSTSELSDAPRLVDGENLWVSLGGKLTKRPGLLTLDNEAGTPVDFYQYKFDFPNLHDFGEEAGPYGRMWYYRPTVYQADQTITTTPRLVASLRNSSTGLWSLWFYQLGITGGQENLSGWNPYPSDGGAHTDYRSINLSTLPHEGIVVESKLYIKGFPAFSTGEKYASVVIDGTAQNFFGPVRAYGELDPWGIEGPATPARIVATKTKLVGALAAGATSMTVDSGTGASFPGSAFVIYIDYEEILVTAGFGTDTWTITRAQGGTTDEAHDDNSFVFYRNWTASTFRIDVSWGWQYVYCYKSRSGQISNSSPLETDFTQLPSNTGPFYDKIPKLTLVGVADTDLIPSIEIFRTSDGGGTFYHVETIANPGAGSFTYSDDSGTSGDPLPDSELDQAFWAPDLHSNALPKPNVRPDVSGTYPDRCTAPAYFAGRIWYGIRNVLFFSNFEEQVEGIPLESFNDDPVFGNFLKVPHLIRYVITLKDSLLIITEKQILRITGNSRATFDFNVLHTDLGGHPLHPHAFVSVDDSAYFLSNESKIMRVTPGQDPESVSDAIAQPLIGAISGTDSIQILHYRQGTADWLVIAKQSYANPKQFILDLNLSRLAGKPFWFAPWSIPGVGHVIDDTFKRWICFTRVSHSPVGGTPDDGIAWGGSFLYADYADNSDQPLIDQAWRATTFPGLDGDMLPIPVSFTTNLSKVPSGNHVNTMRREALSSVLYAIKLERGGSIYGMNPTDRTEVHEENPRITVYEDALWVKGTQPSPHSPPRRKISTLYVTEWYPLNESTERVAIKFEIPNSLGPVNIYSYSIVFNPDGGA